MKSILLAALAIIGSWLFVSKDQPPHQPLSQSPSTINNAQHSAQQPQVASDTIQPGYTISRQSLQQIKKLLYRHDNTLSKQVINHVLVALQCARKHDVEHNHILTIIDFSLPSNKKRLWVFDTEKNKLLFHTYVSHGIKSGSLLSNYFSNKPNSKATSIGIYYTEKAYRGRHGPSLKLHGLDKSFNDRAYHRFIVMHGSWYVNEQFIKKYGRVGRSWGCPTVPMHLTKPIIDTIKDKSLLIAYYPGVNWLVKSKFLNCDDLINKTRQNTATTSKTMAQENETRDPVLFADINNNNKREQNEPVLTIAASTYQQLFHKKAPLKRMLRRQIKGSEYIVLNEKEFMAIKNNNGSTAIYFVIPEVKKVRGYYATEMKIITLGKIKKISPSATPSEQNQSTTIYTVYFENKPSIILRPTQRFIRWLGL